MFKLLKNLRNSDYYYYEDFEEDGLNETDEQAALADKKSLNGAVQSVDEMTTRLEALKKQVELLKKSNSKETEQLKMQLSEAISQKEGLELQSQVTSKTDEYYQNLESTNKVLEKQLVAEGKKVSKLQESLTTLQKSQQQLSANLKKEDGNQGKISVLEEELATTKRQLIKYIKHEKNETQTQALVAKKEQQKFAQEMSDLRTKLLATKEEANLLFNSTVEKMKHNQSNNQEEK